MARNHRWCLWIIICYWPAAGWLLTDADNIFGLTTNWRWTFWINVPIGILAFIIITIYTPNFKHAMKSRIDFLARVY